MQNIENSINVFIKINRISAKLPALKPLDRNKKMYSQQSLFEMLEMLDPFLLEEKLSLVQIPETIDGISYLSTIVIDEDSKEFICSNLELPKMNDEEIGNSSHNLAASITQLKRYTLFTIFRMKGEVPNLETGNLKEIEEFQNLDNTEKNEDGSVKDPFEEKESEFDIVKKELQEEIEKEDFDDEEKEYINSILKEAKTTEDLEKIKKEVDEILNNFF